MSISTYQELQVAVLNGLEDPAHASRVTELIALFEGKVKRELRVRQMESRSTASATSAQAALALPSDFLEMRNLRINADVYYTLQFLPPNQQDTWHSSLTTGRPRTYKIVGSEIIFAPIPDSAYTVEIDYYAFAVLSTSNATNWLLTASPDAYLFGSLSQTMWFGKGHPMAGNWAAKCEEVLESIRNSDKGARWNGSPLVSRPDFVTP